MRRIGSILLATMLLSAALPTSAQQQPSLEEILDRLTRVSDVYAGNALKFTVEEVTKVRSDIDRHSPRKMTLVSFYAYYRDASGALQEKRIRKSAAGRIRRAETIDDVARITEAVGDPMAEHGLRGSNLAPFYFERPYSWIFLFSLENRKKYEYELEDPGEPGRILVRLRPKNEHRTEDAWYATIHVDLETFQIVRAEGMQVPDFDQAQRLNEMLASPTDAPADIDDRTFGVLTVSTDFDVRHHGMRFPSRVEIEFLRHRVAGAAGSKKKKKTDPVARIVQTYRNYRFYGIELTTDFLGSGRPVADDGP